MKNAYKISLYIFCLGVLGCGKKETAQSTSNSSPATEHVSVTVNAEQAANLQLKTMHPEKRILPRVLSVTGKLESPPSAVVSVTSSLGGRIKMTEDHLIPGVRVRAGQILAWLEHESYIQLQQDYLECAGRMEQTEKEYQRQLNLSTDSITPAKKLEEAKAAWLAEKAHLDGLSGKLRLSGISPESLSKNGIITSIPVTAPISGILAEVNVNPGKFIPPDHEMFRILSGNHMHVVFRVFQKDAEWITEGVTAQFRIPGKSIQYTSKVAFISPSVSESGGVDIHCDIENAPSELIPGMFVQGTISLEGTESWVLPDTAVVLNHGKSLVFVETAPGTFEMTTVEISEAVDGWMPVRFPAGDEPSSKNIVISGAFGLLAMLNSSEEE